MAKKHKELPRDVRFETEDGSKYKLDVIEDHYDGTFSAYLDGSGTCLVNGKKRYIRIGSRAITSAVDTLPSFGNPFIFETPNSDDDSAVEQAETTPVNLLVENYGPNDEDHPLSRVVYWHNREFGQERNPGIVDAYEWRTIPRNNKVAKAMLDYAIDGDYAAFERKIDEDRKSQDPLFKI
jgi:hypothetical protein